MVLPHPSGTQGFMNCAALFLLLRGKSSLSPVESCNELQYCFGRFSAGTPLSLCYSERFVERGRDGKVLRSVPCSSCPTLGQAMQAGRTCALLKFWTACPIANAEVGYSKNQDTAFQDRDCKTSLMGGVRLSSGMG